MDNSRLEAAQRADNHSVFPRVAEIGTPSAVRMRVAAISSVPGSFFKTAQEAQWRSDAAPHGSVDILIGMLGKPRVEVRAGAVKLLLGRRHAAAAADSIDASALATIIALLVARSSIMLDIAISSPRFPFKRKTLLSQAQSLRVGDIRLGDALRRQSSMRAESR